MGRIKVVSIAESCKGNTRRLNQDRFFLNNPNSIYQHMDHAKCRLSSKEVFQMYGVFDGMGGTSYGEEAALTSARMASSYRQYLLKNKGYDINQYLRQYFNDANKAICDMARTRGAKSSGTTAALVCLFDNTLYCANIGDTRIYLLRDGRLTMLSIDHTEQALFEKIQLETCGKSTYLNKHRLTQHLGIESEEMIIEPYYFQIKPLPRDKVLICSDGLNEKMSDEQIRQILLSSKDVEEVQSRLVEQALMLEGKDNITVMLLQICKSFL